MTLHQKCLQGPQHRAGAVWGERSARSGELGASRTRKNRGLVVAGGVRAAWHVQSLFPVPPWVTGSVHGCSSGLFPHKQSLDAGEDTGQGR